MKITRNYIILTQKFYSTHRGSLRSSAKGRLASLSGKELLELQETVKEDDEDKSDSSDSVDKESTSGSDTVKVASHSPLAVFSELEYVFKFL